MNKICTSLEQSKKLAEFLPFESADMEYMFLKKDGSKVSNVPFVKDGFEEPECCYTFIPCWSLVALLNVLPMITKGKDMANPFIAKTPDNEYYVVYATLTKEVNSTGIYDNPIDACYELILKLHEQKLL